LLRTSRTRLYKPLSLLIVFFLGHIVLKITKIESRGSKGVRNVRYYCPHVQVLHVKLTMPCRGDRAVQVWDRAAGYPGVLFVSQSRPTVSPGVTYAVVSSCGHDSGHIEQHVAQELAGHWATHAGPAERPPRRHPPHAQTLAPVQQHHG